jgi:hypothetical protein
MQRPGRPAPGPFASSAGRLLSLASKIEQVAEAWAKKRARTREMTRRTTSESPPERSERNEAKSKR